MADRIEEPCARTHPGSVLGALSFFEKAAAVEDKISESGLIRNTVDSMEC